MIVIVSSVAKTKASCSLGNAADKVPKASSKDAKNYSPQCASAIKAHIKMEFEAAMQYLLMGAHFGQDNVNLEGYS